MQFKKLNFKRVIDLKDMGIYDHVTHGDLTIYKIKESDMPENFESLKEKDLGVLAVGEAHGHCHQLLENIETEDAKTAFELIQGEKSEVKYSLREMPSGEMYLKVENEPLLLRHQTHDGFRLYPGFYDIDFQVEADHLGEIRRVID